MNRPTNTIFGRISIGGILIYLNSKIFLSDVLNAAIVKLNRRVVQGCTISRHRFRSVVGILRALVVVFRQIRDGYHLLVSSIAIFGNGRPVEVDITRNRYWIRIVFAHAVQRQVNIGALVEILAYVVVIPHLVEHHVTRTRTGVVKINLLRVMEVTHARLNNIVTHRLIALVVTRVARPRLIDAIVYVHAVAVILWQPKEVIG